MINGTIKLYDKDGTQLFSLKYIGKKQRETILDEWRKKVGVKKISRMFIHIEPHSQPDRVKPTGLNENNFYEYRGYSKEKADRMKNDNKKNSE